MKTSLIDKDEQGAGRGRWAELEPAQLDAGELTIGALYSSINDKDALAVTGKGKIIRRHPCVGGAAFDDLIAGGVRGRTIVRIGA